MRRSSRLLSAPRAGAGVAVGTLLLSACTAASVAPLEQPVGHALSAPPPTTDIDTHDHDHDEPHDDIDVPMEAAPSWDPAAQFQARLAATTAVAAYVSGGDEEDWWATVAPLLSPAAQQAYAATDPANVPGRQVQGLAAVEPDAASAHLARVVVSTDAGDYEVLLSRTGADAPWLVERFHLPAQETQP